MVDKVSKDRKIPASNFVGTLAVNVDNEKLSDAEFRQLVRNTLSIVEYEKPRKQSNDLFYIVSKPA